MSQRSPKHVRKLLAHVLVRWTPQNINKIHIILGFFHGYCTTLCGPHIKSNLRVWNKMVFGWLKDKKSKILDDIKKLDALEEVLVV